MMIPPKNSEQPTILIVDDAPEELKPLIAFLKEKGFQIVGTQNGEEAQKRAEHAHPDLILLDVLMPGMDGFETCRGLKEHEATKDIPVIFMTALTETVDKVKGFDVGGVDYLTKPVQYEEVLARVNAHLMNRKLQQQLQEEHARFKVLSEATFEGILIHDEGCIIEVNQTLEKMFGYQRAEVLGKNVLEFVAPGFHQVVLDHIRANNDTLYEAKGIRQDGSIFPVEVQARTMPYQGRKVRVVAIRDITWQKTMEQEHAQLQREVRSFRSTLQERYKFGEIIGKSPAMQEVYQSVANASASDANVLVCGESGTGKELIAHTIHQLSERKARAFVPVNCGAVPENLFEREFFGHRKGSFTGADRNKEGFFDLAHRGTLFLDEIGELNTLLQVKLLRAIDQGEYTPIGSNTLKTVDVRIIAATNQNLKELLQQGSIREDFYYRIRVIVINLPPLRERKEDIPLLVECFLEQYGAANKSLSIPGRLMDALCAHHWPGNVRELQNELQRYLLEGRLEFIESERIEQNGGSDIESVQKGLNFRKAVEAYEKRLIVRALIQNAGRQGKTAAMLGIPPRTLYEKIKKYRLKNYKDLT